MKEEVSLEGMPPIKKTKKKIVKKFHSTKNVSAEVSVRRQVAEEIGEGEPTKDEKFILLQKYGITTPRIDRAVTKPNWMGVKEWKRKQQDWFKMTKGLVKPQQRPRSFNRPTSNSQPLPGAGQLQKPTWRPKSRPQQEFKTRSSQRQYHQAHRQDTRA